MRLSLEWLADHVDLSGIAPEEIAHELTMKTALIEGVERLGAGLERVRVGLVVHREKHPNADRLSFCRVDAGDGVVEVVCGAPNVATGQKIAYAPVGCTLPNGLTLEARKIRGVVSHGMICSETELGIGEDSAGILVLPPDAPIGRPIAAQLGRDDVVFEIDNKSVTHRADLWGHYGFARELAGIFGRELRPLELDAAIRPDPGSFPIQIDDPVGCPLYLALRATLPALPASPDWLARRLGAAGMRPVSLLVDLSNYVMLEVGQPTHPFDEERLRGGRIRVRRAREGEGLATLDGQMRTLRAEDVVIADAERAIAVAGVMGGGDTEVTGSTRRLLLESAGFEATRVRRTAARLGLRTEAVARFEKSIDPAAPEIAVRRFAKLLRGIAEGARIEPRFAAAGSSHPRTPTLALRPARVRAKLGLAIPVDEMVERLESVGFSVAPDGDRLAVTVPSFRARRDVTSEDDLIEEVGRLAGYERIASELPRLAIRAPSVDRSRALVRSALRCFIHERGFAETVGYSFATDRHVALFHSGDPSGFVALKNSLTADATRLRRSLMPSLLDAVGRNLAEFDDVRLVESGREYAPEPGQELPRERRVLAAVRACRGADSGSLLLEARADVESCLARLRIRWEGRLPQRPPPFAHPGRSIEIVVDGATAGIVATLHPEVARRFELVEPTVVTELDVDVLTSCSPEPARMRDIPAYPPSRRDLSVIALDETTVADLEREIRAAAGAELTSLELFDVYRGEPIPAGSKSLSFRLVFRASDRTLTDPEVDSRFSRIVDRLERAGVRLRA